MIELKWKYNSAKVFTDNIDNETISQLINLLNQEFVKDNQIRIMPDTHAGKGCVVGTTMTIKDKIVPNLVGCDIGCGMSAIKLKEKENGGSLKDKNSSLMKEHKKQGRQKEIQTALKKISKWLY